MLKNGICSLMVLGSMCMFGNSLLAKDAFLADVESSKILIAYFSYSGNTKAFAEAIQTATNGKLYEIKSITAYPESYDECVAFAKKEIASGILPKIEEPIDVTNYSVIFIGSPNWWGSLASPVKTFLSQAKLKGKIIVPFFTHGGGGMQQCEKDIKKILKDTATVYKAKTISGARVKRSGKDVEKWIDSFMTVKQQTAEEVQLDGEITKALAMIDEKKADCVLIRDGKILQSYTGRGVSPLMKMFDENAKNMKGGILVDRVIGRAAAAIAISGGISHIHTKIASETAIKFLTDNGVTIKAEKRVPIILNRAGDGLCPLEESIEGFEDAPAAVRTLKIVIESMKNK